MGKLSLVGTPFSTVCIDTIKLLSPQSDGYRYILTLSARFPEVVALKDITTSTVAEALFEIFSRAGFAEGAFRSKISIYFRHDQRSLQVFSVSLPSASIMQWGTEL